jgi:hypothetical protein
MSSDLFVGGPPLRVEQWLGLVRPSDRRIGHRAVGVILIGWAPLAILNLFQQVFKDDGALWSFLLDFGAHARFLVAAPSLIIAESWCLPRLSRISVHFFESGIIVGEEREKLSKLFTDTARLLNTVWAEIAGVALAYGIVLASSPILRSAELPEWQIESTVHGVKYTAAGYWQAWISLPMLLLLLLGWVWRQFLWGRFLRRISKLRLRLIAAHPDRAGGLKFVVSAVRGYWPLCFACGSIVAGRIANQLQTGFKWQDSQMLIISLLAFVVGFCILPLSVFTSPLRRLKRRGIFEYGTLASALGEQFEKKWLNNANRVTPEILTAEDFSAAIDLYSVVGNVHNMNYFLVDFAAIRQLILVTLLPFVPVFLSTVPFESLIAEMRKLLF